MKTVEIMLVIVITTIFMLVIIPSSPTNIIRERRPYLIYLEEVQEFRDFVSDNNGCYEEGDSSTVDNLIRRYLPEEYDFTFCSNAKIQSIPQTDVYVDTLFFAGNYTDVNIKTIRLYYWSES